MGCSREKRTRINKETVGLEYPQEKRLLGYMKFSFKIMQVSGKEIQALIDTGVLLFMFRIGLNCR